MPGLLQIVGFTKKLYFCFESYSVEIGLCYSMGSTAEVFNSTG